MVWELLPLLKEQLMVVPQGAFSYNQDDLSSPLFFR